MNVRILSSEIRLARLQTRMPFRYGIATMTRVPLAFVHLKVDIDGKTYGGTSSDCLPPKWFTKIPDKALDEEVEEMLAVIRHALRVSAGLRGVSFFELWSAIYAEQSAWALTQSLPPLLAHFGTSLVERALLEAVCRFLGTSLHEALRGDQLGLDLGAIHSELAGISAMDLLPRAPLPAVIVRHTVGLSDPLTPADIPEDERLDDGLPQSLEDCIRHYGLRHFKIKVNGNPDADLDRLRAVARIVSNLAPSDFEFTLDGNEQFASVESFRVLWDAALADPVLRVFFKRLMFVEQPLHRKSALREDTGQALRKWIARPPVIIDESDATLEDLSIALELGYAGTSHKNCKGVMKGVANRCLLLHRAGNHPEGRYLMSGEDLCNIGPVALLQDLAVMGTLGISSVERNGHHYHAGLSQLPEPVQNQVLASHDDLYLASGKGWPTARIDHGKMKIASVNQAPFGVGFELDLGLFEPAE